MATYIQATSSLFLGGQIVSSQNGVSVIAGADIIIASNPQAPPGRIATITHFTFINGGGIATSAQLWLVPLVGPRLKLAESPPINPGALFNFNENNTTALPTGPLLRTQHITVPPGSTLVLVFTNGAVNCTLGWFGYFTES